MRGRLGAETEARLRRGLEQALGAGFAVLARGGAALDAVERAVVELEANADMNAGRGSVLTAAGHVEMDATVMDGRTRSAGAVACVTRVAHPIALARRVMEATPHVLLAGAGAESFAASQALALVDPASLVTEARRAELARARARGALLLDHDGRGGNCGSRGTGGAQEGATVGAVARDAAGHLAAATSTGGMTNQLPGRVGDSALVGAGTWADDATCAVSATGHGEAFVRAAFAHEVHAGVRAGLPLDEACARALGAVGELGGSGGCIALGSSGRAVMRFTSAGMLRGAIGEDGIPRVALFADEEESAPAAGAR